MAGLISIFGFCLIAIVLSVLAVKNAKKGKKYSTLLIVGIVIYALACFGNMVGNKDMSSTIGSIISIIILAAMFPVCKSKQK